MLLFLLKPPLRPEVLYLLDIYCMFGMCEAIRGTQKRRKTRFSPSNSYDVDGETRETHETIARTERTI